VSMDLPHELDPRMVEAMLRYLDRRASAEQLDTLARYLRGDGGRRRQMARLLVMMGHLKELHHQAGAPVPEEREHLEPAARRRRPHRLTVAVVSVAVAAAAALVFLFSRPGEERSIARGPASPAVGAPDRGATGRRARRTLPPPVLRPIAAGQIAAVTGAVRLVRDGEAMPARAGLTIISGTGIELLAPHAHASLTLGDGALVELEGETQLVAVEAASTDAGRAAAARLLVQRGKLTVTAAPGAEGAAVRLVTPLTEVVTGGQLRLTVTDQQTRADVRAGSAEVRRLSDGRRVVVAAGSSAVVRETSALRAVALPQALLVQGADRAKGAALDRRLSAELEAAGLAVAPVLESELGPQHLAGKALVIISSSASAAILPERLGEIGLREAAIPLVTCENSSFAVLGMATKKGSAPNVTEAWVEGAGHPLAAGRTGRIFLGEGPIEASWGQPAAGAVRIVSLPGRRRVAVFAYEAGAPMVGLLAPARRASCFLDSDRVPDVSAAGWDLFAAAVRWAIAR